MMKKTLLLMVLAAAIALSACSSDAYSDDDTDATEESTAAPSAGEDADTGDTTSSSAAIATGSTDLGDVLVDADGLSLYGFTPDKDAGEPTCVDACADAWPPVFVDGEELPEGADPSVFSIVEHPSGQNQLQVGDWPLYRFAGDGASGDTNGQGSGDVWFLAAPDGSLIR